MPLKNLPSNNKLLNQLQTRRGDIKRFAPIILGWGGFVILFILSLILYSSISEKRTEIKKAEELVELLEEKRETLARLESSSKTLELDEILIDTALPSEDFVPSLMGQVQKIATESGVHLKTLQFGGSSSRVAADESESAGTPTTFERVNLQTVGVASFSNLIRFLKSLETASRVVDVSEVRFTLGGEEDTSGSLSATVRLSSYYLGEDTPPAQVIDEMGEMGEMGEMAGEVDITRPLLLDLSSPEFVHLSDYLKTLRVYKLEAPTGQVGKPDPFR